MRGTGKNNNEWVQAASTDKGGGAAPSGFTMEIRWKEPKIALNTFRRSTVKKNCKREVSVKIQEDGENSVVLVMWNEEFQSVCSLSGYKDRRRD